MQKLLKLSYGGGIVAAIIGPTLAVATRQFFTDYRLIDHLQRWVLFIF